MAVPVGSIKQRDGFRFSIDDGGWEEVEVSSSVMDFVSQSMMEFGKKSIKQRDGFRFSIDDGGWEEVEVASQQNYARQDGRVLSRFSC
jgi:hypothetical protein